MRQSFILLYLLCVCWLTACGGGSVAEAPESGNAGNTPISANTLINAASGGTIQTTTSDALLHIPPDSLTADTDIFVLQLTGGNLPNASVLGSLVVRFGPFDTALNKPLSLTLTLTRPLPVGKLAFIARLNNDQWQLVDNSQHNGNVVTAEIDKLGTYAILFIEGGWINSGQGGTVQTADGAVRLQIPANGIAADTLVSIMMVAELDDDEEISGLDHPDLVSLAYRFEPRFDLLRPVIVSMVLPTGLPSGKTAFIAAWTDDGWDIFYNTKISANTVSVEVTELHIFALLLVDVPPPVSVIPIGPACDLNAQQQTVSFVHVADLHSNYHKVGNLSKMRAFYLQRKAVNPYTLFTNGGDEYEKGSLAEILSAGQSTLLVSQAMKFDAKVIGNHDFAWGEAHLLAYSHDPHAVVLSSNADYIGNMVLGFGAVTYTEFQMGCVKVGMFGMVSEPWNELDQQYSGDFLTNFKMRWDLTNIAETIVERHRQDVDIMVMLSHLGIGFDIEIAKQVKGIDLVLGGHTHGGPSLTLVGDEDDDDSDDVEGQGKEHKGRGYAKYDDDDQLSSIVVQPNFDADGVTQVELIYDLAAKKPLDFTYLEQPVAQLTQLDDEVEMTINTVLTQFAPQANQDIAVLESNATSEQVAHIAAQAGIYAHQSDAALFDPDMVWQGGRWRFGGLSPQQILDLYRIERQKSDTPGFSAMYWVEVDGTRLSQMISQQNQWIYVGPSALEPQRQYKVLLHKGPALNPGLFFGEQMTFDRQNFASESFWAIEQYGRSRSQNCLFLDSDHSLPSCNNDALLTIWQFDDSNDRLKAQSGVALLSYRDNQNSGWGPINTKFGTASELGITPLVNPQTRIMGFAKTTSDQGYTISHQLPANGNFASEGLVSDYTIILDILWPSSSDGQWRALLQTSVDNSDDADWFTHNTPSGGIGVQTYFGSLQPNRWYRIGLVMHSSAQNGQHKLFIDGQMVGSGSGNDKRWALQSLLHLFTDNGDETQAGFVASILFAGYAMTETQIRQLGKVDDPLIVKPGF